MKAALLIMLLTASYLSRAQESKVCLLIKDTKDTLCQNIDPVNCIIFKKNDSTYVLSTWSDESGNISFRLPSGTDYILKAMYMGAILKEFPFCIQKGIDSLYLGVHYLDIGSLQLNEVVIQGKRIVRTANSVKVSLIGSTMENIGTLLDVLRETPLIVLRDEEISVLGKGKPTIFVNGREVSDIKEIIHIKSSEIKSIEVLTNPSGRYGVNSNSAINIKTSLLAKDSYGFDILEKGGFKGKINNLLNATAHINKGRLNAKIGVICMYRGNKHHKEDIYEYKAADEKICNHYIAGLDRIKNEYKVFTDITYHLNNKHSLNFYTTLSPKNADKTMIKGMFAHNSSKNGKDIQQLISQTRTKGKLILFSGAYRYSTTKTTADVAGSYFGYNKEAERVLDFGKNGTMITFKENSYSELFSLKCDIEQQLSNSIKVETGGEYTLTVRGGKYKSKGRQTDLFNQKRLSGYISAQYNINDKWALSSQLGIEYTNFKYFINSIKSKEQSKRSIELLPKIALSYENRNILFNLSYNRNVDRPTYNQLSSNHFMSNKYLRWDGNPNISTSYISSLSMDIGYSWANISLSWANIKDGFFEVNSLDNTSPKVVKTTPENLPNYNQLYTGISLNPHIGKLEIIGDIGIQLQDLKYNNTHYNSPLVAYSLRLGYMFPHNMSVRCGAVGHIKDGNYSTGKTKGYINIDFRVSKSWHNGNYNMQLYMSDICNTAYERVLLNTNGILRKDYSHGGTRGILLMFQYKWGKRDRKKSRDSYQDEISRLLK